MMENEIIPKIIREVKEYFSEDYSGHDEWHTLRVYELATKIAKEENADLMIVQLAALLHDVDDIKISPDTYVNKTKAVSLMKQYGVEDRIISAVCSIIDEISFAGDDTVVPKSIEGKCVQDADRLDAIGAIGIARAFAYGGNHNRALYKPDLKPCIHMKKEEYINHDSTTVNHFYEKLFKLKGLMNTASAKEMAEERDKFMHDFIEEFLMEWKGKR